MVETSDSGLKCLLLPLQTGTLLLPNSVVAEIVPAQRHHRAGGVQPHWCVGRIEWRGMSVPLISLESLHDGQAREFPNKTSFVVLHRLQESADADDYYAVCIDGIPHFQFLDETLLESLDSDPGNPYVAHEARLDGATVLIPDLDALEAQIAKLNLPAADPA